MSKIALRMMHATSFLTIRGHKVHYTAPRRQIGVLDAITVGEMHVGDAPFETPDLLCRDVRQRQMRDV